ncbi:phospholipase D family protein [Marinobacterium mangrovicola]|uniref:Putative cardiolipin synthase n=1 Tax=Marinobacterium mangrovicola TaxID=1476959 RepID=A0A4R1G7L9_9GAMM|nr:phospholipase D family protein [Marinobacterium mangrovicola]TCK02691.1 putative cardiolipin synthase [Marinobacterium mangrovicola]
MRIKQQFTKAGLSSNKRWRGLVGSVFFLFLLTGCASSATSVPVQRAESQALPDYRSTEAFHFIEETANQHPGKSGFTLVREGQTAFTARLALVDLAKHTLDLQYYIWSSDATGKILAERLVRAADRGVRVRVLIDDNNDAGRDSILAALDAHPNIEIRLFNPFKNRGFHLWDFATDFKRANHRMHNKILVMDNTLGIVGGRNVGDHYFNVDEESNFRDLDVFAAGPIVPEVSSTFDDFWNGGWAVPITELIEGSFGPEDLEKQVTTLRSNIAQIDYPYPLESNIDSLKSQLNAILDSLSWADGLVVHDNPERLLEAPDESNIISRLNTKLSNLDSSLYIESAYFVPTKVGVARLKELEERGVEVRVLTNSLSTNDVLAAHAGYAKYREDLLEAGVELHELKTESDESMSDPALFTLGESKAALHTKAFAFDSGSVFIGSFNLDPRSALINTELGLYIESEEVNRQLKEFMGLGLSPGSSYLLALDDDDDLIWLTYEDGEPHSFDTDPNTSFWERFLSGFIGLFPVESQL